MTSRFSEFFQRCHFRVRAAAVMDDMRRGLKRGLAKGGPGLQAGHARLHGCPAPPRERGWLCVGLATGGRRTDVVTRGLAPRWARRRGPDARAFADPDDPAGVDSGQGLGSPGQDG